MRPAGSWPAMARAARAAGRPWSASSARHADSGFPPGAPLPLSGIRRSATPLPPPKHARCHRPARRRPARHRLARPSRCSRRCQGLSRPFRLGAGRSRRLSRPARRRRQLHPSVRRSVCRRHLSRRTSPRWTFRSNRCSRRPPGTRRQLRPHRPLRRPHRPLRQRLRLRGPQPGLNRRPGPSSVPRPRRPRPQPRRRRPYPPFPGSPGPCWLPRIASTTTG
jgi:hypothetical protein